MNPWVWPVLGSLWLFGCGLAGVVWKRNALVFFLSIELLLNAANLLFVAGASFWGNVEGLVWVFFVLIAAAVEVAVGLAILMQLQKVDLDQINSRDLKLGDTCE